MKREGVDQLLIFSHDADYNDCYITNPRGNYKVVKVENGTCEINSYS